MQLFAPFVLALAAIAAVSADTSVVTADIADTTVAADSTETTVSASTTDTVAASATDPKLGDLAPDAKLRVGIKFRPAECTHKSDLGDNLSVHYTGIFRVDGSVFDSSVPRDEPFDFVLGTGDVIKGWDRGLVGMCVGEKRKLTVPSDLAYGSDGWPSKIPGNATLVFDVELLKISRNNEEL